jgi:anti-sigma factor RsiW
VSDLDLPCTTVAELATQYLEDELSVAQQTSYETHLIVCANCAAYLHDIREVVDGLHALPADPVDPDERRRILDLAVQ